MSRKRSVSEYESSQCDSDASSISPFSSRRMSLRRHPESFSSVAGRSKDVLGKIVGQNKKEYDETMVLFSSQSFQNFWAKLRSFRRLCQKGSPRIRDEAEQKETDIGGGVFVPENALRYIDHTKHSTLTNGLLTLLFSRNELAESSITGKKCNLQKDVDTPKPMLDQRKHQAVVGYVMEKCKVPKKKVLKVVMAKLNYEDKVGKPKVPKTAASKKTDDAEMKLGSKVPAIASQPLHVNEPPWETQPQAEKTATPQPTRKPLNHAPHIRNPKLRQYYLQGPSWDLSSTTVNPGQIGRLSANSTNKTGPNSLTTQGSPETELDTDPKPMLGVYTSDTLPAHPHSPSPEAEYDKLLDVEVVPMPDGQLCLLALPPECCQGKGPESTPYLKLFCRYITDRKGVVSGILLVTSYKIFFDPCKTHPLVREHGCEEYLLSFSVDSLASIAFFSDISHVHFSTLQQRKKEKTFFRTKSRVGRFPDHKGELARSPTSDVSCQPLGMTTEASRNKEDEDDNDSRGVTEAEQKLDSGPPEASVGVLGAAVLSSAATLCCRGQEAPSRKIESSSVREAPHRSSSGSPGTLMFVRLRVQSTAGKKKSVQGVQLEMNKPLTRKDTWLALSQESSDELHAHLTRCRPDLCVLDGGEEEGEVDEEEFVLIEDGDGEEEEKMLQRHRSSGDDWEMVLMEDSGEPPASVLDRDLEGLANILDNSHILEASHIKELCKELPPCTVGHAWQLAYSTFHHGASLKSLYRRLSATDSPMLLVIKDALDEIFGAFLSHPLRPSEVFYGTGETFLFMLHPRFKCFRWTGENSFFIKGDLDSFAIGGGRGHFGLWLDENLYLGRSSPCYTFNNCSLSEADDFRVMELEVWTFI